jgi:rhodanese-related sulfurtransferase
MVEKISAQDLKQKLDEGQPVQLVATLEKFEFDTIHIPGSVFFENPAQAVRELDKSAETVVYCTGPNCIGGPFAYQYYLRNGFEKVRLFSGGLEAWAEAGFPLVRGRGF